MWTIVITLLRSAFCNLFTFKSSSPLQMGHFNCHCMNDPLHIFSYSKCILFFKGAWRGILHHVIDEHEWLLPSSDDSYACKHWPLSSNRDKGWLERDSDQHVALRKFILDKRFLNKIPYYLNFRYVLVSN